VDYFRQQLVAPNRVAYERTKRTSGAPIVQPTFANSDVNSNDCRVPLWFRYGIVAIATLTLCACQTAIPQKDLPVQQNAWIEEPNNSYVSQAGLALTSDSAPRLSNQPAIYEEDPHAPPPAIRQTQYMERDRTIDGCPVSGCPDCRSGSEAKTVGSSDEYLCDGGDFNMPAGVKADWEIVGLEQEDTVGQYDTVDGRTVLTPSNRVCIYAPRFGVVRRVVDLQEYARYDRANGYGQTTSIAKIDEQEKTSSSIAKRKLNIQRADSPASLLSERQQAGELGHDTRLAADIGTLSSYADLQVVHTGTVIGEDKAKLARSSLAAITWAGDQSPQVTIDSQNAVAAASDRQPGVIYHLDEPNKPRLRILKLASTGSAKPGEEVEFTLRVDNIGNREMGNVTIMDNLTTRLAYVPDSAEASVEANFSAEPNTGGSEVLRWEIIDPLEAGDGCILKFRCKVR